MSYQEGITSNTCPISSDGHYAAKHNPPVFSRTSPRIRRPRHPRLREHHKAYTDFAGDLANG